MSLEYDEADDMCPNCLTPWKCNGPHEVAPEPRRAILSVHLDGFPSPKSVHPRGNPMSPSHPLNSAPRMTRPYLRPTPRQKLLLAAYVEHGTVAKAAAQLGITVHAGNALLAEARRRTGLTTVALIHAGTRDGWLVQIHSE